MATAKKRPAKGAARLLATAQKMVRASTKSQIATFAGVGRAGVHVYIKRLVEAGLVTQQATDAGGAKGRRWIWVGAPADLPPVPSGGSVLLPNARFQAIIEACASAPAETYAIAKAIAVDGVQVTNYCRRACSHGWTSRLEPDDEHPRPRFLATPAGLQAAAIAKGMGG